MPPGGLSDLLYAVVKKPTTTSPGTVVVTDGAVGFLVFAVKAPLCASTGVVRSTPFTLRIAPVAEEVEASDQA
jgi:hypothetical protein